MEKEIRIRQQDRNDCAAACVASVCAHYGLKLPLIRIREACGTSADGTTMQGVIDACGKLGLEAAGLKSKNKDIDSLRKVDRPVILHLEKKNGWLHFVVLYGMGKDHARIMDPEDGRMHKTGLKELEEEWSGYIIAVTPSPLFRKGDLRTDIFGRFKDILKFYRKELMLILTGSAAYIAATLSISVFLQRIIDSVIPAGNRIGLLAAGAVLVCLTLMCWFISYTRSILLVRTSIKIDCRLITEYFRKVFSLPLSFFNSMSSGELNSRVSDAYRIRSFITERLLLMTVSIITLSIATAVLMTFYWKLTLIVLSFIPLFILLYMVSDRLNRKVSRRIIEENAKFEQTSIEQLSAARDIKYFNSEKAAVRNIEGQYFKTAYALYGGGVLTSAVASVSDTVSRAVYLTTLLAGAFFVLHSELTVGELVSFLSLTTVFSSPIVLLIESSREITEARISAERIFDILDLEGEGPTETVRFQPAQDDIIEARDISFSFPGREQLLDGLSFKILPGKVNLILGANGSGKSTVAALLMRGYAPQSGSITAGGVDIQSIPLDIWRSHISIVPQKPEIFDGSILDNIVMGDMDYDMRSVTAVCAMAGLSRTIESLPGGITAHTGERGCRLSGGERQKIALARALYRQPKVLILDEAATFLDHESRTRLTDTVRLLKEHKITIVLISHEEDTLEIADNIIDLNSNARSQA